MTSVFKPEFMAFGFFQLLEEDEGLTQQAEAEAWSLAFKAFPKPTFEQ